MDLVWINLLLCFVSVLHTITAQDEQVIFGKLVSVNNPTAKKSLQQQGRNQVFATRALAFMKKDGDLFRVHRPGLLGKKGTISFESVRLPGFFLRQKNKKVHLDNLKSRYILKDATFIESKDAVGESFRLFMHSDQFLCHEAGHGFSLFMYKDSPKRDKLNCAFNIVKKTPTGTVGLFKSKQLKSTERSNSVKPLTVTKNTGGPKLVSQYIKDKTTGQSIPEFKDLVNAIKQQKDPFPPQQGEGLIAVLGPVKPSKPTPEKGAKQKAGERKRLPVVGIDKKKAQAPKQIFPQKLKKNGPANSKATTPKAAQIKNTRPAAGKAEQKARAPASLQPATNIAKSLLKKQSEKLNKGRASNKYFISNPQLQNVKKQQATRQSIAQKLAAMNPSQFATQQRQYNIQSKFVKQENPTGRQIIASVFQQPISQYHATNAIGQTIQYVPPSQWDTVVNAQPHGWTHDAKYSVNNRQTSSASTTITTGATNTFATDNLLTKLHPELNLLHSAHHDVNEVISTDPNIHHIDIQHSSQSQPPFHVTSLPHEAALQSDQISNAISEPVGYVQHISLPSVIPVHDHDSFVNAGHPTPLVVALPHPSIVTSNTLAASELVHKNPDVTLEEAFHKMEPLPSHPIEIASEAIHHEKALNLDGLQPNKAFHMRTHYVTGKAINMNEDDQNTLKEVHVVHHNHHLVQAADEDEKQKFVSSLVDSLNDLCISLSFENELGDRYRLVSTLNPHGYRPKSKRFSLKTIFKEPKKRKIMSFKAYDEEDPHRVVLLNGHKELNIYPVSCANDPTKVTVDSAMRKTTLVMGNRKNEVLSPRRETQSCTKAIGGTSSHGSCCVFPFIFKGRSYENCLPFGQTKGRTWCSLTTDFDKERRWGLCSGPNLPVLHTKASDDEENDSCPPSCTTECDFNCPIRCCTDSSSSSLLH